MKAKELEMKRVVFTGSMRIGLRCDCEKLVVGFGMIPERCITKHTDILVIGELPARIEESQKVKLAKKYNQNGSSIAIVDQKQFYTWLNIEF